jgi:hypothetical protein
MLQEIINNFPDEEILKADGFDDCVIGYDYTGGDIRLIYSVNKILNKLAEEFMTEGMDINDAHMDAIEYFEYNMRGGYVGEHTPIWCQDDLIPDDIIEDGIVESVVNKYKKRSKLGIEKYGTTLQENNYDDFLIHLQQELMDASLYVEKLISQSKNNG